MSKLPSIRIVTGGQAGVDRAALDYALDHQVPCGGWCPKGRKAEDGRIPDRYPLQEMASGAYAERTKQNVIDSDATLILYTRVPDRGTKLTIEHCIRLKKPVLYIALDAENDLPHIRDWIRHYQVSTLHVAGPRESRDPGIYRKMLLKGIYLSI